MGKTYVWTPDRWEERIRVKQGKDDWRKQMKEDMSGVFIIHNEWEDEFGHMGSSVVDGKWYDSEDAALRELRVIADTFDGVEIPEGEYGFTVEDNGHMNYDEYYIQELTRG